MESEDSMSMNTTGVALLVEYQKVHFIALAHGIELIKLKQTEIQMTLNYLIITITSKKVSSLLVTKYFTQNIVTCD